MKRSLDKGEYRCPRCRAIIRGQGALLKHECKKRIAMDNEKEKEQVFGFCGGKCGEDPCLAWNRAHGRNLTTLDTVEDAAWVEAFAFAKNEWRYSDTRADFYAWRQVQKQFPRLRSFAGIQP